MGVLLVANHRTFYDHFVITSRLFRLFGAHHNIFFPVRSTFFYENLLGLLINLTLAVGFMYPPIIRDKKRLIWNRFATDLMVELLISPDNMIGFHPEGTRPQVHAGNAHGDCLLGHALRVPISVRAFVDGRQ